MGVNIMTNRQLLMHLADYYYEKLKIDVSVDDNEIDEEE